VKSIRATPSPFPGSRPADFSDERLVHAACFDRLVANVLDLIRTASTPASCASRMRSWWRSPCGLSSTGSPRSSSTTRTSHACRGEVHRRGARDGGFGDLGLPV